MMYVDMSVMTFIASSRVEKAGYKIPKFDFRIPGVTSISADIHKYGLGIKVSTPSIYFTPFLKNQDTKVSGS